MTISSLTLQGAGPLHGQAGAISGANRVWPPAAEAAQRLGRLHDQALLRIDALGWLLIAVDQPQSAIREINAGLAIASQLEGREATELHALGHAFLARAHVGLGDLATASRCMDGG